MLLCYGEGKFSDFNPSHLLKNSYESYPKTKRKDSPLSSLDNSDFNRSYLSVTKNYRAAITPVITVPPPAKDYSDKFTAKWDNDAQKKAAHLSIISNNSKLKSLVLKERPLPDTKVYSTAVIAAKT